MMVPTDVRPDPLLVVNTTHERDVFSDDSFTRDIKEPTVPYNLAVMVANKGHGEARNVRIVSSQPQIVENEKGLAIEFRGASKSKFLSVIRWNCIPRVAQKMKSYATPGGGSVLISRELMRQDATGDFGQMES